MMTTVSSTSFVDLATVRTYFAWRIPRNLSLASAWRGLLWPESIDHVEDMAEQIARYRFLGLSLINTPDFDVSQA